MGNIGTPRRRIEVLPEQEPLHAPQQAPAPDLPTPAPTGTGVPAGPAAPREPTRR